MLFLCCMNLITGATGMVGMHLMHDLLASGAPVRALVRAESDRALVSRLFDYLTPGNDYFRRIEWQEGDVLDIPSLLDAMNDCTYVYHCAAVVSYHRKDRAQMYKVNVEGTANVVNAALESSITRLCHVSSIAALGRLKDGDTLDEAGDWVDSPLNTHYGITKHLAELEVWRGMQEGLSVVIVNPGFIVGPGDFRRSSAQVFSKINEGMPMYPPGGTAFVSVRDVSRTMIRLMHTEKAANERYIVIGENGSMKDLFTQIALSLGKTPPQRIAQPWMLQVARVAEWLKEKATGNKALVTRETVRNASHRWYYSTKKIQTLFPDIQFESTGEAIKKAAGFF
jgi:dihydroflavonol-4-reductase